MRFICLYCFEIGYFRLIILYAYEYLYMLYSVENKIPPLPYLTLLKLRGHRRAIRANTQLCNTTCRPSAFSKSFFFWEYECTFYSSSSLLTEVQTYTIHACNNNFNMTIPILQTAVYICATNGH